MGTGPGDPQACLGQILNHGSDSEVHINYSTVCIDLDTNDEFDNEDCVFQVL